MSNPCQDIQNAIPSLLDGELEGADLRELEVHISDCKECECKLASEERVHSAMRSKLQDVPAASEILKQRLQRALKEEESEEQRASRGQRLHNLFVGTSSFAAAAALALFAWTQLSSPTTMASPPPSSEIVRDAARQHLQERPLVLSSDVGMVSNEAASYMRRPVRPPSFPTSGIRLRGWTPAQIAGRPSVTFVYDAWRGSEKHRVNVHVVNREDWDLSSTERIERGGATLWVGNAYGFQTVTYDAGAKLAYVFSSDMPEKELIDLVNNSDIVNMLDYASQR